MFVVKAERHYLSIHNWSSFDPNYICVCVCESAQIHVCYGPMRSFSCLYLRHIVKARLKLLRFGKKLKTDRKLTYKHSNHIDNSMKKRGVGFHIILVFNINQTLQILIWVAFTYHLIMRTQWFSIRLTITLVTHSI